MIETEAAKMRRRRPQDIRALINKRLKAIGKTPNWLSKQQRRVHENTCRTYLYGNKDTTGEVIAELFAIVGLAVVPTNKPAGGRQDNDGSMKGGA